MLESYEHYVVQVFIPIKIKVILEISVSVMQLTSNLLVRICVPISGFMKELQILVSFYFYYMRKILLIGDLTLRISLITLIFLVARTMKFTFCSKLGKYALIDWQENLQIWKTLTGLGKNLFISNWIKRCLQWNYFQLIMMSCCLHKAIYIIVRKKSYRNNYLEEFYIQPSKDVNQGCNYVTRHHNQYYDYDGYYTVIGISITRDKRSCNVITITIHLF